MKYIDSSRKPRNARLTSFIEPRKSNKLIKRKSQKTDYLNILKYRKKYASKLASPKSEVSTTGVKKAVKPNSFLRGIDIPKVIRFVGCGILIKPILTPCSEMEGMPLKINVPTVAMLNTINNLDSATISQKASYEKNRGKLYHQNILCQLLLHSKSCAYRVTIVNTIQMKDRNFFFLTFVLERKNNSSPLVNDERVQDLIWEGREFFLYFQQQ